jgi:glycosyltransferase involved in cell wall biosynthesis
MRSDVTAKHPPTIIFGVMLGDQLMAWPGRNQLMKSLAKHTRVVLLQASAESGRRARLPRRPHLDELDDGLFVLRDAFDARTHRLGRRAAPLAAALDGRWLTTEVRRLGPGEPLLWLTVADPVLSMGVPRQRLIYDCMDPNFLPGGQQEHDRQELALAARAAVSFASATSLLERMRTVNPKSFLLPNAAPVSPPTALGRPAALAGRPGPVAGYLGTVDWRFDVDHVLAAATALPEVTFAVVGRINADQESRVAPLRDLANVLLPGPVSLAEGDDWIGCFDVGLIPFIPGPMNDAINPVKMFMYLAAGLPVVSTAVAECVANPWVDAANSPQQFAAAISRAMTASTPVGRRDRRAFAARNTWDNRADSAIEILENERLWE